MQIADVVPERRCQRALFFEAPRVAHPHEVDFQLLERAATTATSTAVCITTRKVAALGRAAELRRSQRGDD